jgi:radical SAM superfamily enzyme YgiQ (UPF0313 family)
MSSSRKKVVLAQLPIPPLDSGPAEGNVPLAAGYLKLFARRRGLLARHEIQLLPPRETNLLGDEGIVQAILARRPQMVGFTCYLWNIERTLHIVEQLKQHQPDLKVVLGGPEITADNRWVLSHPGVDFAVLGEGEQTFAELLAAWDEGTLSGRQIAGLWSARQRHLPPPRPPLASLDEVSSPYRARILPLADEPVMPLETARGCRFHCRYCYYPKQYAAPYLLSAGALLAELRYAARHDVRQVVLLDPTLNQRPDFAALLELLARGNHRRQFSYAAELRAEGIDERLGELLHRANFAEVEVGLQSVSPDAQRLMGRPVPLAAFVRGVRAMLRRGIKVRTDLIIGLPGDTVDSVRRGIYFLLKHRAFSEVQVFHLSVLPGTAFRRQARRLGLVYQNRPPYYVLRTPTLSLEQMVMLMAEAEAAFSTVFDPLPETMPPPRRNPSQSAAAQVVEVDLASPRSALPPADRWAQALTLWCRSPNFQAHRDAVCHLLETVLARNPHTTLLIVLEPTGEPETISPGFLQTLLARCYRTTNYLDRYYSAHPHRLWGSKRLVVALPRHLRHCISLPWLAAVEESATISWRETRNG